MISNFAIRSLLIAGTLLLLTAFPNLAFAQISFMARTDYGVGTQPSAVAVGDFNGDGKLDLAVANSGSGNVSVLLGNGDGTFQPAMNLALGVAPFSIALSDLNGDGKLDIVVGGCEVLLGNGDGTFQPPRTVASSCGYVAVGDFNGDGKPDLAVADGNPRPGNVSVLLGNGDGTFQPAQVVAPASPAFHAGFIGVADLKGDAVADLVVTNQGFNQLAVLLGNGDGTFQSPRTVSSGNPAPDTNPLSFSVGDFNGDGVLDLAVANPGDFAGDPGNVAVLLGNGDGTFRTPTQYPAGQIPTSVAVGDFNGDGKLDLVVASQQSNNVSVLLGNGDGTFQGAQAFATGTDPQSVAVGDFNGDGKPDLVVANFGDGTVSVLINNTAVLTVNKTDYGSGTVSSSPAGIDCGSTCSSSFPYGATVTLTATPDFLSGFGGWSGCDSTSGNTCTVTMNSAKSVTADFRLLGLL